MTSTLKRSESFSCRGFKKLLHAFTALPHLVPSAIRAPDESRTKAIRVQSLLEAHPPFTAPEMSSAKVPLLPQRVVAELREGLPDNALILSDSSKWARWLGRYFRAARGQILSAHDYEPAGWSVAGALGAKLAHPARPVVCVCGDGAFLMSAMELSTAVNHGIHAIWIIMNDSRLGIIYDLQKSLYRGRIAGTTFSNPDLVGFAESLGISGRVISQPGELADALRIAVGAERSFLLDVRFDANEIPGVRPRSLLITKAMGLPDPTPGPENTRLLLKLLATAHAPRLPIWRSRGKSPHPWGDCYRIVVDRSLRTSWRMVTSADSIR